MLKLKVDGWLYNLYYFTYRSTPPYSLCPFFWAELFALLMFPITWISYPYKVRSVFGRMFYSVITWVCLNVIGYVAALAAFWTADVWWSILYIGGSALGFVTSLGLLVIGIVIGLREGYLPKFASFLNRNIIHSRPVVSVAENVVNIYDVLSEQKRSIKQNYCPRIEWYVKQD